jgi:hypothetical protein
VEYARYIQRVRAKMNKYCFARELTLRLQCAQKS